MIAEKVRDTLRATVDDIANARGRSVRHVLAGLAITGGAVALSALIAWRNAPPTDGPTAEPEPKDQPPFKPPGMVFAIIWPPLFLALTLSGLRIWNAPRSPARSQALTLWGMVQALNALWMTLGSRRLGGQLTTAVASLGTSAAYALRARQVDAPAANMAAPYLGWIGFANVLSGELWRHAAAKPTIH